MLTIILFLSLVLYTSLARDILKLEAVNFELALTSYPYVVIIFYDDSEQSKSLVKEFDSAALLLNDFEMDGELAKINAADPELKEIMDAYRLSSPSIKVFRRGSMSDYRGPYEGRGMADYIRLDSQPSVRRIGSFDGVRKALKKRKTSAVLGFFESKDLTEESTDVYSMDGWGQFQAAADSLRGQVEFFAISDPSIIEEFQVDMGSGPVLYLITETGDDLNKYPGELLEVRIVEWVLKNAPPSVGELSFTSTSGELYATQFFSSKTLKFILFLPAGGQGTFHDKLANWTKVAQQYAKKALFSYIIGETVADIVDYFDVNLAADVPLIVAHHPLKDHKYKSSSKIGTDYQTLEAYVAGVVTGEIRQVFKSEPVPKAVKGPIIKAVGSNVVEIVSDTKKDVLLEVYAPWCSKCKALAPTYDILGKALQGDPRILVAKIDGSANDLPPSWGAKNFPMLLWFPASDKPYTGTPTPKPYWDAGVTLHELVSFVVRHSSFDAKSLKVATSEQLGSLLAEEETLREKYEKEERWNKRNEGRKPLSNMVVDYFFGEVVFDGLRWHFGLIAVLVLIIVGLIIVLVSLYSKSNKASEELKDDCVKRKKNS